MKATEKQMTALVEAAVAYAELAERHMEFEGRKTRMLQEAANMARAGDMDGAKSLRRASDMMMSVFDYTDAHKALIKAVKPFRNSV